MVAVTVKQVAARVGLPSRTVRYYDWIGLVRADERSTSGMKIAEFVAFRERLAEYRARKRSHDEGCCGDGAFCTCLDDVPDP